MEKFWFVLREGCSKPPRFRHPTLAEAIKEADRLAKNMAGSYLVLEAVCTVKTRPVKLETTVEECRGEG